jgi:hypothetical protein
MTDHFAEAEQLLQRAADTREHDLAMADQFAMEAQVHALLCTVMDPDAGCGDEPPLDWGDLMAAAAEAWPKGGMPLLPQLVAFCEGLGLVVIERKPDADTDPT